jgi:SAM-dependent methyltransferase
MLRAARKQLGALRGLEFRQMDAARIPDGDRTFNVVIANHMLYHVPDRAAVFAEVIRVLRPSGRFYAATNGNAHMRELDELTGPKAAAVQLSATRFGLDNGDEQLAPFFGSVEIVRHQNPLSVTDASAVTAYVRSLSLDLPEGDLARIGEVVQRVIASTGAFHITRDSGVFICGDPRGR